MTTTAPAKAPAAPVPVLPARWTLLLLPVGPAAVAALRFLLPYLSTSTAQGQVAAVWAHPDRESAVLWLGLIATLTLVPGFQVAGRLTRAAAPRLTAWALALIVPAYLCVGGLLTTDNVLWSSDRAGLPRAEGVALLAAAHPTLDVASAIFVAGHVIGTVIFGAALLRSATVPAWAGWAMLVSQPLHFLAAVVLLSPALDLTAWLLTAVAMAMIARALYRGR